MSETKFRNTKRVRTSQLDGIPISEGQTYFDIDNGVLYKDISSNRFSIAKIMSIESFDINVYDNENKELRNTIFTRKMLNAETELYEYYLYFFNEDGSLYSLSSGSGGGGDSIEVTGGDGINITPSGLIRQISVDESYVVVLDQPHPSNPAIFGPQLNFIKFNTNLQDGFEEGELGWNSNDGTLDLGLGNGIVLQIGQENHMYMKADVNIINGRVIKSTGGVGGSEHMKADYALSTEESKYIVGVSTQAITLGDFGYVTTFGVVRGIDLSYISGIAVGDILYLKPNTTTGELTNIKPTAGHSKTPIAMVLSGSSTN
jgi:hypothetical protein